MRNETVSYPRIPNLILEDVRIKFRNLRGEAGKFNRAGDRSFSVILPNEDLAKKLKEDGWNVRSRVMNEDGDIQYTLPVSVMYQNFKGEPVRNPPRIYLIAGNVKTELEEDTVSQVDFADIQSVDLTIRPYAWENDRGSGVKAYLKNMYVTVSVDRLDQKWSHLDDGEDDELPFDM